MEWPISLNCFIPTGMEWPISFRPEWNGPFHSGRNGMTHFIPAGMEWPIPFRPEWTASFRPEWNGPFHSGRNEMSIPWTQIRNMQPGRYLICALWKHISSSKIVCSFGWEIYSPLVLIVQLDKCAKIPDTDTLNSYWYQIPIPSLRFMPILTPIPISVIFHRYLNICTKSYRYHNDTHTDIKIFQS